MTIKVAKSRKSRPACRHKRTALILRMMEDIYDRRCRACKQVTEFNVRI